MPKEFEDIRKSVWESIRGKTNPRTKKPYTESDAYAIATKAYQKNTKKIHR